MTDATESDPRTHRFGQTWRGEHGLVLERWCVDCDQFVKVEPIPFAEAAKFPRERKRAPVCRDCGTGWRPVRRGECAHCGSDAGPLTRPIPPG